MRHPATVGEVLAFLILLVLVEAGPSARAEGQEQPGKQLYLRYCGACHGPEAKGDGIVATALRVKPPDLTLLARAQGGEFQLEDVVKTIDGRELPRAHGERTMPVWGQILSEGLGSGTKRRLPIERRVQGRILSIGEYLRTIQVK